MAKIVTTASFSFTKSGASRLTVSDFVKFKPPGKKADEVAATTFADTAKRRMPALIDYDGASLSVMAPNAAVITNAKVPGVMAWAIDYSDATKGYWGCYGYYSAELGEVEAEQGTVDTIDCALTINGIVSRTAIYGAALANAAATSTSKIPLSGNYSAQVVTTAPVLTQLTVTIGGKTMTVPVGKTTATATLTSLTAATADAIDATITAGTLPTGASFIVSLTPA